MKIHIRERKHKSGIFLYLQWHQAGKDRYEHLGLSYDPKNRQDRKEKRTLAESIRAKRELEMVNTEHGFVPHFKKKANFVEYFENLAAEKNDKSWRHMVLYLKEFTGGHIPFGSITEEWLEELKKFLLSKLNRNTSGTYFAKIKAALNQAVRDKIIVTSPGALVKQIPKAPVQKVYLTEEEIRHLAEAPCGNPCIKLAFLFACYTGLRISDMKRLEWRNIQGKRLEIIQKKTEEPLYLPLADMAMEILKAARGSTLPFPTARIFQGLPSEISINRALKLMAKKAGIGKDISFHTGRHTFATLSLTMGMDIYTVSKLIGHTDIKNTQIYAKVIDKKMEEAVQMLPKVRIAL
jgi:integrase